MTGNLKTTIRDLLVAALPGLFSGEAPPVTLTVSDEELSTDSQLAEQSVSEPRPDDQTDQLAYDPANPPPSLMLTRPPYPGPRRVYLTATTGSRTPLGNDEVQWDRNDSRVFTLQLRPTRDLTDVDGVEVLYGIAAVFTVLKANKTLIIELQAAADNFGPIDQAEALTAGVIALNREYLIEHAAVTYADGDYNARIAIKNLKLIRGTSAADNQRRLEYQAETELKIKRALREDEGQVIESILSPGRVANPDRPVDVDINVEA
jgi:hypothetical protein